VLLSTSMLCHYSFPETGSVGTWLEGRDHFTTERTRVLEGVVWEVDSVCESQGNGGHDLDTETGAVGASGML